MDMFKPYEDMLYPQCELLYSRRKDKTISKEVWEWLQQQALVKINGGEMVHDKVRKHWSSIVHGVVPFGYMVRGDVDA